MFLAKATDVAQRDLDEVDVLVADPDKPAHAGITFTVGRVRTHDADHTQLEPARPATRWCRCSPVADRAHRFNWTAAPARRPGSKSSIRRSPLCRRPVGYAPVGHCGPRSCGPLGARCWWYLSPSTGILRLRAGADTLPTRLAAVLRRCARLQRLRTGLASDGEKTATTTTQETNGPDLR